MWRAILSIFAVVLNVIILGVVALAFLGFAVILSRQTGAPMNPAQMIGFVFVAFAGIAAVVNIVAIAVGARLRGKAAASPGRIASEFS